MKEQALHIRVNLRQHTAIRIRNYTTAITQAPPDSGPGPIGKRPNTTHVHGGEAERMKPAELKMEYIQLRADGKSYRAIAAQLHISRTTCAAWEQELKSEIDDLRRAELSSLYESFGMAKEARITALGGTLERINAALEDADFSKIPPEKLLDYKLRYMEALKLEYVGGKPALELEDINAKSILAALGDLLNRTRAGEIPADQAQREGAIIAQLLRAYETTEVKAKLEELELIVGGKQ